MPRTLGLKALVFSVLAGLAGLFPARASANGLPSVGLSLPAAAALLSPMITPDTDPEPDPYEPPALPTATDTLLITSMTYDTSGRPHATTDPMSIVTRQEYDAAGRVTRTIENYDDGTPGGGTGDVKDRVTAYTYTPDGQVATMTAKMPNPSDDQVTTYIYSASLTDKGGPVKSNSFLRAVIYPDSDDEVYSNALANGTDTTYDRVELTYTANGTLYTRKDARGVTLTMAYDDASRNISQIVTAGSVPGAQRVNYAYTEAGTIDTLTTYSDTSATTITSQLQYEYNGYYQVTTEYQSHSGAVVTAGMGASPKVQYAYDTTVSSDVFTNAHRPTSITYPNGRVIHTLYNDAGDTAGVNASISRVTAIATASTRGSSDVNVVASYLQLGDGRPVVKTYPTPGSGMALDLTSGLDSFGRVTDQKWATPTPVTLDQQQYGYDRAGNRLYRKNPVATTKSELFAYDALHRLASVERGTLSGGFDSISGATMEQNWTLDQVGNWSAFVTDSLDQTRTHNKANEITDITDDPTPSWADPTHDAAGNMTVLPKPFAPTTSFTATYDAWNRLITVVDTTSTDTISVMAYDAKGRRISKTITNTPGSTYNAVYEYYHDGQRIIEQRNGSDQTLKQYVWAPPTGSGYIDELVQISMNDDPADGGEQVCESLYWVTQDANFNVTALIDSAGDVVERYLYTPYGERQVFTSPDPANDDPFLSSATTHTVRWQVSATDQPYGICDVGHQGLFHDEESGLIYNRARHLHPGIGRFVQRDPMGYVDGMNAYAYYAGMHGGVDPSGLYDIDFHYYVTYYLLRAKCWDIDEANLIAGYTQYVDDSPSTWPDSKMDYLKGNGDAKRYRWHFSESDATTPTMRNSPSALANVQLDMLNAIGGDEASFARLGTSIHPYEDTWSHSGFSGGTSAINKRTGSIRPNVGHADAPGGGHFPDFPYKSVNKSIEAAHHIYNEIPSKCGCNYDGVAWSDIDADLRKAFIDGGIAAEPYENDYDKSVAARVKIMQDMIKKRFGDITDYDVAKWKLKEGFFQKANGITP